MPTEPVEKSAGHGILEPARVALQAAELAQRRQVLAVELPEQVVDRVQHRRRVRLDRDPVRGAQVVEYSAVMIETIDADEAWWPPTFTPEGVSRTLLAWWMIDVASHSTRCSTASSTRGASIAGCCLGHGGEVSPSSAARVQVRVCRRASLRTDFASWRRLDVMILMCRAPILDDVDRRDPRTARRRTGGGRPARSADSSGSPRPRRSAASTASSRSA